VLVGSATSFGAEVGVIIAFPEEQAPQFAETSSVTTQLRLRETTFEALVLRKEDLKEFVERPIEVSAAVEGGRFSLLDEGGTQIAFKGLAQRTWSSGLSLDFHLNFEHASFDDVDGDSNGYLTNLGAQQRFFNGVLKIGGFFTWTFVDTEVLNFEQDAHSFGFGTLAAFQKDLGPLRLSGGVIYQFLRDTGDLQKSNNIFSFGVGTSILLGKRFTSDLEVFHINNINREEDPVIVGAGLTFLITPSWRLSLGWKTMQNIEDFTSHEGFLGTSVRF
jgi:hypothetical protein